MKNANGINPIVALILTVLVCVLTVVFFTGGHVFWGIVFAIITLDFCQTWYFLSSVHRRESTEK